MESQPSQICKTPARIYLLKFNNRNTRTSCEMRRSDIFNVNFEHFLHLF